MEYSLREPYVYGPDCGWNLGKLTSNRNLAGGEKAEKEEKKMLAKAACL